MDELNQPSSQIPNNIPPTPLRPSGFAGQAPQTQTNIVPPSPAADAVQIRTMESDMRSVSGGVEPAPQFVTPPSPITGQPQPITQAPTPSNNPVPPAPMPAVTEVKPSRLIISLGIFLIIICIAWITYAYLLPFYYAMTPAAEPTPEVAAPEASTEGMGVIPPPAQTQTPVGITPLGGTQSTLPKVDTDGSFASIMTALTTEAKKNPVAGTIQEISITNGGVPMNFDAFMGALLPEAQTNGLAGIFTAAFDPIFSAYIYYDEHGAWPGYIAKENPASQIDAVTLANRIQAFETSSYENLFLADPGIGDAFKTGQARGKYVDRFIPLATQGALFNYGIFGNYLIINTSNNGLVKALDALKL